MKTLVSLARWLLAAAAALALPEGSPALAQQFSEMITHPANPCEGMTIQMIRATYRAQNGGKESYSGRYSDLYVIGGECHFDETTDMGGLVPMSRFTFRVGLAEDDSLRLDVASICALHAPGYPGGKWPLCPGVPALTSPAR